MREEKIPAPLKNNFESENPVIKKKSVKRKIAIKDGIIELDSDPAKEFGFTSDKFEECSSLWKEGKDMYLRQICEIFNQKDKDYMRQALIDKNKVSLFPTNNIKELIKNVLDKGYNCKLPLPSHFIRILVKRIRFEKTYEYSNLAERWTEVWVKKPKCGKEK